MQHKKREKTERKRSKSKSRLKHSNERLLLTCAPEIGVTTRNILASDLIGLIMIDDDGTYRQVISVRIDERTHKIYGACKEVKELAPYMFGESRQQWRLFPTLILVANCKMEHDSDFLLHNPKLDF